MDVTATEAKKRLGQMFALCQREPVTIEKSRRRHRLPIAAARFDARRAAESRWGPAEVAPRNGDEFCARYKDWVDAQHRHFETRGIWNAAFRTW